MRLVTIRHDGVDKVAELDGERFHLLHAPSMLALIAAGGAGRTGEALALTDARLLAPIPQPRRNILCVGKNYREHVREFARSGYDAAVSAAGEAPPEHPIVFTKFPEAVIGPDDSIPYPAGLSREVDYEGEIAVVIGRAGRAIARRDALAHVFGYTLVNDVTARDLQKAHKQWFLGKSLDGFCPMGPAIVTADAVAHDALSLATRVNGEPRQAGTTSDLIFDVPALIAAISAGITLLPGDIIATGTPSGVGIGFDPPRFLAPGDLIEIELPAIGLLRNRVG